MLGNCISTLTLKLVITNPITPPPLNSTTIITIADSSVPVVLTRLSKSKRCNPFRIAGVIEQGIERPIANPDITIRTDESDCCSNGILKSPGKKGAKTKLIKKTIKPKPE